MIQEQPHIIIRPAVAADAEGVARVHVDAWRTTYRDIVPEAYLASLSYEKRQRGVLRWLEEVPIFCVAEDAETGIVGFATGGLDPEEKDPLYKAQLRAIYILQEHQHRGIGCQLVSYVASQFAAGGLCSMLIWALSQNTNARRFYESLGGKYVRTRVIEIGGRSLEEMAYGWTDITPLLR